MEDLELLKAVESEYKDYLQGGWNKDDAASRTERDVNGCPYIYKDKWGEPSHCIKGDYVLIFDDGIYKKIKED